MFRTENPVMDAELFYNAMEQHEEIYELDLTVVLSVAISACSEEEAREKAKELISFKRNREADLIDVDYSTSKVHCIQQ